MKLINESIETPFEVIFKSDYADTYVNKEQSVAICDIKVGYVPIENFKAIFNGMSETIKREGIKKLIFDKRQLSTFDQPSMEWYVTEWKKEMYDNGLTVYRKILPDLEWFKKCVESGHDQISKTYPDSIMGKLDIIYCNSVQEAIEK